MLDTFAAGRVDATVDEPCAPEPGAPEAESAFSPALAAALAASAALAACGGGGGGGGGGVGAAGVGFSSADVGAGTTVQAGSLTPIAGTATGQTYVYTQAKTDDEAARFLLQAQFSASEADIAAVRSKGYLPWLGEQVDMPPAQKGWDWIASKPYNTVNTDDMVWNQLIT
ncbi:MAG: hypothetical protein KJ832_24730, partial [Gammaproteobacteria bacterium]|nr:hypothetical protein [Gammaproteobacteria bacterium]